MKILKQPIMPIPAILITLLTILTNYRVTINEMPPGSFVMFMTLFFILGWIFVITVCIKYYYRLVLLFFAIYWFASFIFCTIPAFVLLFNTFPPDFVSITNVIFVSPFYGLHDLLSELITMAVGAGFSVVMAIICFLCTRRKGDSLPKPKRRRKKKQQEVKMK